MKFFRPYSSNKKENDNEPSSKKEKAPVIAKIKASDMPKNLNTYLGQKGYTILKSELLPSHQQFIKEQLLIKPCTPGAPIAIDKTYPVYRESDKKLYVPRYYGEQLFGPPKETKITEGDDISLEFQGTLRDYQKPVIEKYIQHVSNGGGGLLELFCGW